MDNQPPTLTQRVLKGSSVVMAFTLLSTPFGYLIRVLYSRSLSIEMFGLFYAVLGLFNVLIKYNGLGFGYSVAYLVPKYINKKNYSSAWISFKYHQIIEIISSLFISLILFFTVDWLALHYFKTPHARNVIQILLIYFISDGVLAALNTFLTGLQMELYYSSMNFVRQVMIAGFSVLFVFFDKASIINYAVAWSAACALTTICYYILFYLKHDRYVSKLRWKPKQFKKMLKYAVPVLVTSSVTMFISQSDVILLTIIKGVKEVGIYNIILPIITIPNVFLSPINRLIFPLVSDLMEGRKKKVTILINSIVKLIPFIGFYFALFILIFPGASVTNLFGARWVSFVKKPLSILTLGYTAALLATQFSTITTAMGKVKQKLKISVIVAIANILLGSFSIYYYGIMGLAVTNSLIYLLSVFLFSRVIKVDLSFSFPWKLYLKTALLGAAIYASAKLLHLTPKGWGEFIAFGAVYSIVFAVFGYLFKVVDNSVIREFRALLIKTRKAI